LDFLDDLIDVELMVLVEGLVAVLLLEAALLVVRA